MGKLQIALFVWRFLSPLPLVWRLHQVIRSFLSPFGALVARIPPSTDSRRILLDLGCGHGIFLALARKMRPDLDVIGIDLDESKISKAKTAFQKAGMAGQHLAAMSIADFPASSVDFISVLDVMYLVPLVLWAGILKKCHASLKPGGLLLLKEMNTDKRLKFKLLTLEETLAVKVLRITLGNQFTFPAPQDIRTQVEAAGFSVEQIPLDKGYHVPHMLWVGRKLSDE